MFPEEYKESLKQRLAADDFLYKNIIDFQSTGKHGFGLTKVERQRTRRQTTQFQWDPERKTLYYIGGKNGYQREVVRSIEEVDRLVESHHSTISGHWGWNATYASLSKEYFWRNMIQHIKHYIECCPICKQRPLKNQAATITNIALDEPWEVVGVDLIESQDGPESSSPLKVESSCAAIIPNKKRKLSQEKEVLKSRLLKDMEKEIHQKRLEVLEQERKCAEKTLEFQYKRLAMLDEDRKFEMDFQKLRRDSFMEYHKKMMEKLSETDNYTEKLSESDNYTEKLSESDNYTSSPN